MPRPLNECSSTPTTLSLVVLAWERDRKLKRLDTRVRNGDEHLRPFRTGVWRKT